MKLAKLFSSSHRAASTAAMASTAQRPQLRIVLDWDGTLTCKDTMSTLGHIPKHRDLRTRSKPTPLTGWADFGKAWMEDYSAHARDYRPSKDERMTVVQESEWLRSLKAVEEASAERVAGSGFFRGVDGHDVVATAQQAVVSGDVRLRPGVLEFLNKHTPDSDREDAVGSLVEILSVNWSAHFIRESLVASTEDRDLCGRLERVLIMANEIQGLEDPDGSNGAITGAIQTSADKLVRLDPPNPPDQVSQPPTTVYIGDSLTDFDCLLAAYAGICIRDEPMGSGKRELAETFERLGIPVHHVLDAGEHRLAGVWWARDFKEVETWVCEWQEHNRDSRVGSGSSSRGG